MLSNSNHFTYLFRAVPLRGHILLVCSCALIRQRNRRKDLLDCCKFPRVIDSEYCVFFVMFLIWHLSGQLRSPRTIKRATAAVLNHSLAVFQFRVCVLRGACPPFLKGMLIEAACEGRTYIHLPRN